MLMITGPGRCGTSVLAYLCLHLGHDPGGEWDPPSNSGMEDAKLREIHNSILNVAEDHDGELPEALRDLAIDRVEEFAEGRTVAKCCLFYRHPILHGIWREADPTLQVISLWRDPEAMAKSWQTYPHRRREYSREWLTEWASEKKEAFDKSIRDWHIPTAEFTFPDYLDQSSEVLDSLQKAGLSFDVVRAKVWWNLLIKKEMVHQWPESSVSAPPTSLARRLWSAIRSLVSSRRLTAAPS